VVTHRDIKPFRVASCEHIPRSNRG
jgi:hypothetical protein